MSYDALDVSEYIIYYIQSTGGIISPLKLQKILYFAQADFLVSTGKPCFSDEIFAYDYGPVIPSVYQKYKIYGGGFIPCRYADSFIISNNDKTRINEMVDVCQPYSATELTTIIHQQSPWKNNYHSDSHAVIPKTEIEEYFRKIQ